MKSKDLLRRPSTFVDTPVAWTIFFMWPRRWAVYLYRVEPSFQARLGSARLDITPALFLQKNLHFPLSSVVLRPHLHTGARKPPAARQILDLFPPMSMRPHHPSEPSALRATPIRVRERASISPALEAALAGIHSLPIPPPIHDST